MIDQPPAVQRVSGLVLQGPAIVATRKYVRLGMELQRRRDQVEPSPAETGLLRELDAAAEAYRAAAMSRAGHGDVPLLVAAPESSSVEVGRSGRVTTREVAVILQVSQRHVRRMVGELGGIRVGAVLLFDRETVELAAAERAAGRESA